MLGVLRSCLSRESIALLERGVAPKFWIYLAIFIGGGLGSALRHESNTTGVAVLGPLSPAWTIFINVTVSLVMGLSSRLFPVPRRASWRAPTTVPDDRILGGYTTFSAFSLDVCEPKRLWRCRGLRSRVCRSIPARRLDRKSTRLNSSHLGISYAVFCLKK